MTPRGDPPAPSAFPRPAPRGEPGKIFGGMVKKKQHSLGNSGESPTFANANRHETNHPNQKRERMKQEQYIPPRVEVIEVRCEAGFQASVEGWGGHEDLGSGTLE